MSFSKFRIVQSNADKDYLSIHKKNGHISAQLKIFRFEDSDTGHKIVYIPSIELSGYGESYDEAKEMLKDSLDIFFSNLVEAPMSDFLKELKSLGWIRSIAKSEEFSKAYVDISGALKNFNTDLESVKTEQLEVAA